MKPQKIMKLNKITLAILSLLSCLLFSFYAGTGSLKAQERQQGWSIGVSPFYLGAKIKTTTENATLTEIVTDTRTLDSTSITFATSIPNNVSLDATPGAEVIITRGVLKHSSNYDATAIAAVVDICEDGIYDGKTDVRSYGNHQFDATSNSMPPAKNGKIYSCFNHFQRLAASFSEFLTGTVVGSALSHSVSNKNTSLSGNGLQLGYDFEKFRLSLSLHQWSAGDDKLNSQIVLLDYFLLYGLYAGAGLAQTKLETSLGSDSKIAPVVHFGYKRNFSKNFSIEAGLLWVGTKLSIKQTNAAPVPTRTSVAPAVPSPMSSSVLVGGIIFKPISNIASLGFLDDRNNNQHTTFSDEDRRVLVTGKVTATYSGGLSETSITTVPTKTTIEVETPASLFIRFVYRFR